MSKTQTPAVEIPAIVDIANWDDLVQLTTYTNTAETIVCFMVYSSQCTLCAGVDEAKGDALTRYGNIHHFDQLLRKATERMNQTPMSKVRGAGAAADEGGPAGGAEGSEAPSATSTNSYDQLDALQHDPELLKLKVRFARVNASSAEPDVVDYVVGDRADAPGFNMNEPEGIALLLAGFEGDKEPPVRPSERPDREAAPLALPHYAAFWRGARREGFSGNNPEKVRALCRRIAQQRLLVSIEEERIEKEQKAAAEEAERAAARAAAAAAAS